MTPPGIHWRAGGAGEPLLLINGWSASGLLWPGDWVARLEEQFRVIRPDNRGAGWSRTAPRPFSVADMADDVRDVLCAVGATRARVLGLSMGGMIAQELAVRHPELVSRLVLVGTRPPAPAAVVDDASLLVEALARPKPGQPLDDFFRGMWSRFVAPGFAESQPAAMEELVAQILRRPTPRRGVLDQVRAMASWHGPRRLARIGAPTTVIHGDQDTLVPVANGRKLASLIPGARFEELSGVGHLVPHEAGDVLIDAICREHVLTSVAPS